MTGRELLEALSELPPAALDLPVILEGCDCYGQARALRLEHGGDGGNTGIAILRKNDEGMHGWTR